MTECARCGDCCDPVTYDVVAAKRRDPHWRLWLTTPDPRDDEEWKNVWRVGENAWEEDSRPRAIRTWLDKNWLYRYWIPLGDGDSLCAAFDEETRTCTAHDDRPPVCSDYPWYNRGADLSDGTTLPDRCSFWEDVPMADRPATAAPVTLAATRRTVRSS